MEIKLNKPLINSHFNDNGKNTFKDIDIIYIKNININIIMSHYHFFRSYFLKASMNFVNNNSRQTTDVNQEAKIEPSQIALVLFDGSQDIINKSNELLLKICFKDADYKNKITEADLKELDYDDWEVLISNFLHSFWLDRWLTGAKTN